MTGVIAVWTSSVSVAVGTFATVCGAVLGAVHGNLALAASVGERGFLAGLIAGAIAGLCVAVNRIETRSYLSKIAGRRPSETDWPTAVEVKPRYRSGAWRA